MADSGAIRAGRAFVEIFTQDVEFQRGLKAISTKMRAWGATMTSVGTKAVAGGLALAGPLAGAAKIFADMGDELAKASTRTGVSVEQLSRLKYAADQSGSSLEGLENGLKKMAKTIVAAGDGNPEAVESLRDIGLSVNDLAKLSPDEQFVSIANAISQIPNPTNRAAAAMKIFGKNGTELLPLMVDGAKGINALIEQANKLGLVMSTEDAKAAEEFGDRMSDLWAVAKSVAFTIGGAVAPVIRIAAIQLAAAGKVIKEFVQEHRGLVIGVAAVAVGLLAAGAAALVMGTAFSVVGGLIGTGITLVSGFVSVMGTIGAAVASPLGILIAGIAAGIVAIYKFTDAGAYLTDTLGPVFQDLQGIALEAFGGIKDALAAGDWQLAAQIAWAGLKYAWTAGVGVLKQVWADFKGWFVQGAVNIFAGILSAWVIVNNALDEAWVNTVTAFEHVWDAFADIVLSVWDSVAGTLKKGWNELKGVWDSLFGDGTFDVQAANRQVDQQSSKNFSDRENARAAKYAQEEAERKAKIDALQRDYEQKLSAISDGATAFTDTDKQGTDQELRDLKAKLDAAKAEQKTHIREMASRAAKERKETAPDLPTAPSQFSDAMEFGNAKTNAAGTFNPNALFGFGGGSVVSRIEVNTRKTYEALDKYKNRMTGAGQWAVIPGA